MVLSACGTVREHVVFQEVKVPVYVVVEPPVVQRPELEISTLSEEQKKDPGELAKAHKITIKQLQQYSENLEKIIEKQRELAKQPNIVIPNNLIEKTN